MYCTSPNTVGTTTLTLSPTTTFVATPTTTITMMSEESTAMEITTLTSVLTTTSLTTIRETTPSALPSITSTPNIGMEPTAPQTVFRFLRPQENYILQVSPNQQSINLNCTAFYNGSNNITIKWRRNGRLIFNNTEQYTEMNIVSTILKINGQSLGRYTCIFIHSSGQSQSVRELQIISTGKTLLLHPSHLYLFNLQSQIQKKIKML